jgi:hypothetical protein
MSTGVRWTSGFVTSTALAANVPIPIQATTQKGDYLVAFLESDNTSAGKFTSSGWGDPTTGAIDWDQTVDSGRFTVLVKRSDGTEGGTTVTFASSGALGCAGVVLCLSGVDETTIIDAVSAAYSSSVYVAGNVTLTAATITTTKANDLLVWFGSTDSTDSSTAITTANPSGFTDQGHGQDTSGWNAISISTKALTTAGVVGTNSAIWTQGIITNNVGLSKGQIAFAPFTLEQYAFRFGVDDNSESTHTWAASENANYTATLGSAFLVRVGVNATADPPDAIYKLKYRKNGSGSYTDVPVGATTTYPTPTVVSTGTGVSGAAAVSIGMPSSFAAGDLLLMFVETANQAVATAPSGWTEDASSPQGTGTAAGAAATRLTIYRKISDGTETAINIGDAGDHTFGRTMAIRGVHQTTPIHQTSGTTAASSTSVSCPSVTTSVNNCLILNAFTNVTDTTTSQSSGQSNGSLSGLTETIDQNISAGNGGGITVLSGGLATAGSTGNTTATLAGASVQGLITLAIQPPATVTNEIYINLSSNITASGEATTARLTAPSGKSTSDFTTGRRWDDENGTDSVNIGNGKYTELEYSLTSQSPAVNTDYYEFRVYNFADVVDTYTNTPKYTVGSTGSSVTGTGALTVSTATLSGTGKHGHPGSGSLTATKATASGAGLKGSHGTGSLTVSKETMSGTGVRHVLGTGSLTDSHPTVAGTGKRGAHGTGSLTVTDTTLIGSGTASTPGSGVTGAGALTANAPSLTATARRGTIGTGSITSGKGIVAGVASTGKRGTGALTALKATLAGTAIRRLTGTGVLNATKATLAGTAHRGITIIAALIAKASQVIATAVRRITGTGAVSAKKPTVFGLGTQPPGTGANFMLIDTRPKPLLPTLPPTLPGKSVKQLENRVWTGDEL